MPDIFGPGQAATNVVTVRPSDDRTLGATDTWIKGCSAPGANDGTVVPAGWANQIIANLRAACRAAGVPDDNADDMLWRAMQGSVRLAQPIGYVGTFSQSVTNGVATLITGYTQESASLSDCTFAGGVLTVGAASAGLYAVVAYALSPTANTDLFGSVLHNVSNSIAGATSQTATSSPAVCAVAVRRLAATDTIRFSARQFSGASQTLVGRLSISRLGA